MRKLVHRVACLLGLVTAFTTASIAASTAQAAVFHDNTGPTSFGGAFRTGDQIADDVPFTGSQTVTSFSFLYHADATVNATIKFSTVNPTTGGVGTTVATFTVPNLASGDHVFTMNLPTAQQFTWTATPGIYHFQSTTGGFFSIRFTNPNGSNPGTTAGWVEASGHSLDGFYDVTLNQFITFQGDTSASFYLQLTSANAAPGTPQLTSLQVTPLGVVGGASAQGLVTLSEAAPAGGALVTLASDDPAHVAVPATVTVPAGQTSATFAVATAPVPAATAIGIAATFNGIVRGVVMSILTVPAGDQVSISQAEYRTSKRELRVSANSSNGSATLTAFVTSTNALIGTLSNQGGGSFRGEFNVAVNPQQITVRSSSGGSATVNVTVK